MTRRVAVLGVETARAEAARLEGAEEVILLDPSPDALLRTLGEVRDPIWSFLIGALPVLPLPDAFVDEVVGADDGSGEVARVSRA
jgi:hypothetical protein